ncbi:carbohydrate ABC transporter permease [Devosia sp. SL43]|uniref:carbohydrate ABC transporter permease n=1 Tax=Devosia sp. SL43 TaxID=2806348 RepID=UPI001F1C7566|nr:carbohydrate ABC transporter permease [Devosia sp. SL43]UJW87415.1 carbohydrate ABC transporter permease [Devosia sp. SL43]
MTAEALPRSQAAVATRGRRDRPLDLIGIVLTAITLIVALASFFPIYWAIITSVKPDGDIISGDNALIPGRLSFDSYIHIWNNTNIATWYVNSFVTSILITALVIVSSAGCAYALSQLDFPGRRIIYVLILACFMVPMQALIVNHFVLMAQFKLLNTWAGIILPQLIVPVVIIVYKQFFDSVPKEFREAAQMDSAGHFKILFRIYLPMNWGVTAALAIITFIGAWNSFLWPFLAATGEATMTVPVGITQVKDAYGIVFGKLMASAVVAGLPVAIVYLIFQRRVTQAIMLSAGVKG